MPVQKSHTLKVAYYSEEIRECLARKEDLFQAQGADFPLPSSKCREGR